MARIVTGYTIERGVEAFTQQDLANFEGGFLDQFDEYVWQEQPSKDAATKRHMEAMEVREAHINAGNTERDYY
jgi:hypothetical protein